MSVFTTCFHGDDDDDDDDDDDGLFNMCPLQQLNTIKQRSAAVINLAPQHLTQPVNMRITLMGINYRSPLRNGTFSEGEHMK